MAQDAECLKNKKLSEYKESVKAIGNSWIICRSQSHSGRIYYFNTLTGKSAWNLSDAEIHKAQLLSNEGISEVHVGDCPEPPEPPVDTPHSSSHQNVRPEDTTAAGARIYNKQIINNQFSKPYAIPTFQNTHCHCSALNTVNETGINVTPVYNPPVWAIPSTHQVLLASAVSAMANQVQPIFNNPNIPIQNTLPNYLHIGNQAACQNPPHFQGFHKKKFNKYPAKWNQNSQRNSQSYRNNDLRDILSTKRKDQRSHLGETEQIKPYENHGNEHTYKSESEKSKLTSDDLDLSDIDEEWLEAKAIGDISRAWKGCSDADCWIVVANARVMLNNRKFLSQFIKPEEQIFLLTPLEVVKQLRSATGDTAGDSRLVQRARCALRFAAQQMDKVPAVPKNLQNHTIKKCCLELIEQNYHVLLLLDDNELSSEINTDGIRTLTVNQLKEYLNQKFNTVKTETLKKITVTICNNNGEVNQTISCGQSMEEARLDENIDDFSSIQHKEREIQSEYTVKKTVDACIQTDFVVPISTEIIQTPFSDILKSPATMHLLKTEIPKAKESQEIYQTIKINDIVKPFNENKEESNVATKKIKLKRNNISTSHSPVKKPQFRWRKQRAKPSMTTTPSPKVCVVSNNQTFASKSTPSSLISISDLLPLQNDNFSDLAKSIEFSDASIEKTTGLMNEVIEESSLDVISNSIDEDIIPKIKKNAVLNELKDNEKEEIVMFGVTSDLMGDYLSRGCDEWLSRFVQIMEECLTQVLQQEPSFFDPALPAPWSVYEATTCIKKKFEGNSKIVFACNKCCSFLLQISDSRGKIFADLNPSDFMRLYSYGLYLIEALQSLVKDSEDLQIANESLAKLLDDIRNPKLDLGQNVFMDTFLTEKEDHSANISELVTDAGNGLVDAANISPPNKLKQSCEPSSSRYNLRSSQISNGQNANEVHEDDSIENVNIDESFFTTLRLQKTSSSTDIHSATPFSPPQCPSNYSSTGGIKEITKENEVQGPKIIRKINFCPEIELKLKNSSQAKSSNASNAFDEVLDDDYVNDSDYYENGFSIKDSHYENGNDKFESNTQYGSEDHYTQLDVIGVQILKFVVDRTTYPVHKVLADLHGFCEATCRELNSPKKMDQIYKTNLTEKVKEVHECLVNLCNHLKSVLCREDMKTKVRIMLEELGFMSCEIKDTHVAEYGDLIQKYLDQANILSESVNLIAAAIREKE